MSDRDGTFESFLLPEITVVIGIKSYENRKRKITTGLEEWEVSSVLNMNPGNVLLNS